MKVVVGAGVTEGLPVPVTVKVYAPAVVPGLLWPPPPPLLPPHPAKLPSTTIATRTPSIDRQLRRRAGMPMNTRNASSAPAPPPVQPRPLPNLGQANALLEAAVVFTVTVAVPLVVPELRFTAELAPEQVGRSVAPVGDEVSAQVSVTAPAYQMQSP
jgi:hypothetical protein